MHSERWAGQFHFTSVCICVCVFFCFVFFPCKGRLEEVEERADEEGRRRGKDRGRWDWNRNPSQWIKKLDSSFCLVVQPCILPTRHRSFSPSLSPCPAASPWWLIRTETKLATETEKIMHKRWVQFIVFSWGPRGELKLWIYAVCDWMRAQTHGTDVERAGVGGRWFRV